ncbi:DUF899 domain-containing protein [Sphingomonas sp. So64.6b]|uniref:DUF899 family protein n=1 Tax=Sphingomonas sp. So64.6b TaxID=2997354 RepID=UPI0015FFF256|nr:DUF899 family protein [Sphingomonas sp. So64.6b]QNA86030.1 DUF899 domain-containing protein [Sphingomonas sp. So64.6b]
MSNADQRPTSAELAAKSNYRFPGESAEYRVARSALLAEEIELRRQIERVAEHRRQLPPGRDVTIDYPFEGENGPVHFADLFQGHDSLVVYSFMFGPERERPCPMCTAFLGPLAANAADILQRVGLAVVARAPIERLVAFKQERGWRNLPLYTDTTEQFGKDYLSWTEQGDNPGYNVFTRQGGTIRHFWGGEMSGETADPGQDPRGAPDLTPLWNVLDTTPEGRGSDWYPSLDYD